MSSFTAVDEAERYLVIYNISKKRNVQCLVQSAAGYNFKVILVGWEGKGLDYFHLNDTIEINNLIRMNSYQGIICRIL